MRHAEVAPHAFLRRAAFAIADEHDLFGAQPRHAAGHSLIVAAGAIPVNLAEIREDSLDQFHGKGALGMPCAFDSLPRRRNGLCLGIKLCFLFAHR